MQMNMYNTWGEELAGWERGRGCMVRVAEEGCRAQVAEEGCTVSVAAVGSGSHSSLEGVEQRWEELAGGLRQDEGPHQVEG